MLVSMRKISAVPVEFVAGRAAAPPPPSAMPMSIRAMVVRQIPSRDSRDFGVHLGAFADRKRTPLLFSSAVLVRGL